MTYDADLRPLSTTTTWQNGGGTIYSDALTYDAVGNVTSRTTTQAAVPGVANSGGTEVQNFCYNEQNELVWASNASVPTPPTGQTCGSTSTQGTLGNAYTASYVYTHLGQLWQGPLNGSGTQEQYLYCGTGPHQLTDVAPLSTSPTCSSPGTTDYSSKYDAWGNMTTRSVGNSNTERDTLTYDGLDHLLRWNGTTSSSNKEAWYFYDAAGNRVMLRAASTGSGGNPATSAATITTYAFGLEDHQYQYSGSGSSMTNSNNDYYYSLDGTLIGMLTGAGTLQTQFLLTDSLGSVVAAISTTAGSAQVVGNQLYGPYGNLRYSAGTIGTAKGFTGQYNDALTGLDYYVSRSYDPIIGRFLSADDVEGNLQGADPYAYVSGNPETDTDPTGEFLYDPYTGQGAYTSPTPGVAPVIFQYTVPHRYAPPVQAHLKLPTLTKVPTATRNTNNNTLDPGPCAYLGCKAGALVQTTETRWVPQTITVTHWHTVCIFICMTMPYTTSVTVWRPVQVHGVAPVTLCPLPYDCSDDNGSGNRNNRQREGVLTSSDEGGSNGADETSGPVNSHGVPYPVIIDPRTGEPVPFPDGATERIPRGDRVPWNGTLRRQFIKAWEEAGYEALNWADYEIHHILPREFGGTNDFWNLVPVESNYHRQVISPWWAGFKP